jgi:hypothetical protein
MVGQALRAALLLPWILLVGLALLVFIALAIIAGPAVKFVKACREDGIEIALFTGAIACFFYGFIGWMIFGN